MTDHSDTLRDRETAGGVLGVGCAICGWVKGRGASGMTPWKRIATASIEAHSASPDPLNWPMLSCGTRMLTIMMTGSPLYCYDASWMRERRGSSGIGLGCIGSYVILMIGLVHGRGGEGWGWRVPPKDTHHTHQAFA